MDLPEGTATTVRKRRKLNKNKNAKPVPAIGTIVQILSAEKDGATATVKLTKDVSADILASSGIDFSGNSRMPDFRMLQITNSVTKDSWRALELLIDLSTGSVVRPPEADGEDTF